MHYALSSTAGEPNCRQSVSVPVVESPDRDAHMNIGVDESPRVSVVVPTYYRNRSLAETLRSVQRQSYEPVEIVVVDDSGEGHAEPAVAEFDGEVVYVELERNRGANGARNAGAEVAAGEYIHFLDDDDQLREEKLAKQVEVAERSADVGVVYTGVETSEGRVTLPNPEVQGDVLRYALSFDMWPCMTSSMLIAREALSEVLPFSDRPAANDLEFMIELATATQFGFVDEVLLLKRVDRDSLGHSMAAVEGRKGVIRDYAQLYAEQPAWVRRKALAETYLTQAEFVILEDGTSFEAIGALLKHAYYTPDSKLKALVALVAGCLGRPGFRGYRYLGGQL